MSGWRAPPTILFADEKGDEAIDFPDGRTFADIKATTDHDTAERLRLGRMCLNCFEPFEVPFPKECNFCRYPVAARQERDWNRLFRGDEGEIGPSFKVADEIARMEEHLEYEARTGIVLPDSVKFPNPKPGE